MACRFGGLLLQQGQFGLQKDKPAHLVHTSHGIHRHIPPVTLQYSQEIKDILHTVQQPPAHKYEVLQCKHGIIK